MWVGFDEVSSEDAGEKLGRCDWMFLCLDVNSVFHRVGSHNYAVVGLGVPAIVRLDY